MKLQKFRIGERVRTPKGVGFVMDVRTWKQAVLTMTDAEAKLFTAEVKYKIGHREGDHKDYQKILVGGGARAIWSDNMETKKLS